MREPIRRAGGHYGDGSVRVAQNMNYARHNPLTAEAPKPEQRVGALSGIPDLLQRFGADHASVLHRAGLASGALANKNNLIPYESWGVLLQACADATRYPQFGLLSGRMTHLDDLGVVGEAVRNSHDLRDALQILTVYQHLNSSGGLLFVLKRATIVDVGYAVYHSGIQAADQMYDHVAAALYNVLREIMGARWCPNEVFLPHSRPRDITLYRNLFKVTPHFDSEFCALRFPAYWLDQPIAGADLQRRRQALARAHGAGPPHLIEQVRRALRTLLLNGKSSGDDLAQMLAMHRRTLNRRLRDCGTTFKQVLDEVRFEIARQLLCYSELTLDDIAATLGYAGVSPFMRSFRRWSDSTPGQWRRRTAKARSRMGDPDPEGETVSTHDLLSLLDTTGEREPAPRPIGSVATFGRTKARSVIID